MCGANNGQLKQTIRADGTVLENTYDLYGRITESKVGGKVTNSYTFDNDGNLAKHLDKVANLTTTYDYNDSNKVVRSEVYSGDSTATKDLESRMQYTYTKSGLVGTLSYEEQGDEVKTYKYTYAADELPTKSTHPDTSVTAWTYDSLRRNSKTVFTPKEGAADAKKLYTTLTYAEGHTPIESGRTNTTTLVDTYTNKFGSSGKAVSEFTYKYDGWGNITKITDVAGKTKTYSYNDFSEVTEAVETYGNGTTSTYKYSYDAGGNILTETVNGKVNSYVYDSVWKDKLVSHNGKAITYDEAGHPLNYMGSTMTWDASDRLTSISGKTANGTASNISYTYLSDGSRRSKTVDGVTTTYHYNNGLLLSQSTGDETLRFYYDSTGKVVSIGYQKGSAAEVGYFFARNAQGDIIGVYRSSDSKLVGTYEYDLWGRPISTTEATAGIDTNDILTKNPFRYRGYYFDNETGFYYLQSRYYDSAIRRFISADTYISTGQGIAGHNMFAYCLNNPIVCIDNYGQFAVAIVPPMIGISLYTLVGYVLLAVTAVVVVAWVGTEIYNNLNAQPMSTAINEMTTTKVGVCEQINYNTVSIEREKAEEKAKAKVITQRTSPSTKIYRWGGTNPGNLKPREKDVKGLSFSFTPEYGAAMTTIEAVNKTGILCAIPDGDDHISVRPTNASMKAWIKAGSDSPWTRALKAIVVKYVGGY